MIKQLLTIGVPLLAPVALYLLYSWHLRSKGGEETSDDPFSWREIPWIWLLVCGIALLATTLVASSFIGRTGTEVKYEAPRFEEGKRVPGQFVK